MAESKALLALGVNIRRVHEVVLVESVQEANSRAHLLCIFRGHGDNHCSGFLASEVFGFFKESCVGHKDSSSVFKGLSYKGLQFIFRVGKSIYRYIVDCDVHLGGGWAEWIEHILFNLKGLIDSICELGEERLVIGGGNRGICCG